MKKRMITLFTGILALALIDLMAHSNGPGRGGLLRSTGAPGETHCGACHQDGIYDGELLIHELSQGAALQGYVPGATHLFLVEIISPDTFFYGGMQFQIVDSLGNRTGNLLPGNTANAAIALPWYYQWHQYIEHPRPIYPVLAGGVHKIYIGAAWIADPTYAGSVDLYASGALCDGDSTPNNDRGYNGQLHMEAYNPLATAGDSTEREPELTYRGIWVDWRAPHICLRYFGSEADIIHYQLIDINGKMMTSGRLSFEPGDGVKITMPDISPGIYYFQSAGSVSPRHIQKIYIH